MAGLVVLLYGLLASQAFENMIITDIREIERHIATIEASTRRAIEGIAALTNPKEALRQMKFETVGRHPIEDRALNFVEQINQTFSYLVALNAAKWLLEAHPDAGGFSLAPGAHAAQRLDIMSVEPDLVGAEAFAATSPRSNNKLDKDLKRLATDPARHRYAFFYSPGFEPGRHHRLEKVEGVQVHCVDI